MRHVSSMPCVHAFTLLLVGTRSDFPMGLISKKTTDIFQSVAGEEVICTHTQYIYICVYLNSMYNYKVLCLPHLSFTLFGWIIPTGRVSW